VLIVASRERNDAPTKREGITPQGDLSIPGRQVIGMIELSNRSVF